MKQFYLCLLAIFSATYCAMAQDPQQQNYIMKDIDSLKNVIAELQSVIQTNEEDKSDNNIWKNRAKYFNLGFSSSTLTDITANTKTSSTIGTTINWGKSYYLHNKPILGIMKIGLDFSWLDFNYAKYSAESFENNSEINQLEYGIQLGTSATINPVHHLKVSAYFRITPSISLLTTKEEQNYQYVTFCNAGLSVAWKVISLGVEWRTGSATYDSFKLDNFEDEDNYWEDSDWTDILKDTSNRKLKTNSYRFYIGFRF